MRKVLLFIFLLTTVFLFGQQNAVDSVWKVRIVPKNKVYKSKYRDSVSFNPKGFYLVKNCYYKLTSKSKGELFGILVDVKKDSLVFSNYFNANVANTFGDPFFTFSLHYKDLKTLNLLSDRALNWYTRIGLNSYEFEFIKDTGDLAWMSPEVKIYRNSDKKYKLVPYLTYQGFEYLYEWEGKVLVYSGTGLYEPDRNKMDYTYDVRNVAWITPSNVEVINGLAIGVYADNYKHARFYELDTLTVNGINLELNPFGWISIMNPSNNAPFKDSIEFYYEYLRPQIENTINGLSVNITSNIDEDKINGVNIVALMNIVDEVHGVSIAGLSNFAYVFRGVMISGLNNRVTDGKGVQIGLFNKAKNFKGIQIGLWNNNGKFSLPIVNMRF